MEKLCDPSTGDCNQVGQSPQEPDRLLTLTEKIERMMGWLHDVGPILAVRESSRWRISLK